MTALRGRRRRRTRIAAATGVMGLVALGGLGFAAYDIINNTTDTRNVETGNCQQAVAVTPGLLLGVADSSRELTAVALLAMQPEHDGLWGGGTIVSIPPSARTPTAEGTIRQLSESTKTSGTDSFTDDFASLVGATPSVTVVYDQRQFGELLAPIGAVDLPADLVRILQPDRASLTAASGQSVSVAPTELAAMFASIPLVGDPVAEVDVADTLWRAVVSKVGPGGLRFPGYDQVPFVPATTEPSSSDASACPPKPEGRPEPADAKEFFTDFMAGPVSTYRIGGNLAPGSSELVYFDFIEAQFLLSRLAPSLISASQDGLRIYLISSLPDDVTRQVIGRMSFLRLSIVLRSQPTDAPPPETVVQVENKREFDGLQALLRKANITKIRRVDPTAAWEGVDAIVTLGASVADEMTADQPPPDTVGDEESVPSDAPAAATSDTAGGSATPPTGDPSSTAVVASEPSSEPDTTTTETTG